MPGMDTNAYTDEESSEMHVLPQPRGWAPKKVMAIGSGIAVLLLAPAAVLYSRSGNAREASVGMIEEKDQVIFPPAREALAVEPRMEGCASKTENCMGNKCCQTSGYKCFRMDATTAKCASTCPGGNCWVEKPYYTFKPDKMIRDNSIFCFTVYLETRGTNLKDTKSLPILKTQLANGVGLFTCNDWEVFSDVPAALSDKINTRVLPANSEYGKYFRKDKPDHYTNTPMFLEAWKLLKADGRWAAMSWVVKVDAPTVFFPDLLRAKLSSKVDTSTGVYYPNCEKVMEGYFGNLEVVSAEGFKRFLEQYESSYNTLCWRMDKDSCKKEWKYGPWGEDLFMQKVLDGAEVGKVSDFTLSNSGTCPGNRPADQKKNASYVPICKAGDTPAIHPMRTADAWAKCYTTVTGKSISVSS